jgi:hypothetical protein
MPGNWHVRFGVGAGGETPPAYTTWVGNDPGPPGRFSRFVIDTPFAFKFDAHLGPSTSRRDPIICDGGVLGHAI